MFGSIESRLRKLASIIHVDLNELIKRLNMKYKVIFLYLYLFRSSGILFAYKSEKISTTQSTCPSASSNIEALFTFSDAIL